MSFDNVCKLLAEKYPADFVSWLTADDAINIKVLKTELSTLTDSAVIDRLKVLSTEELEVLGEEFLGFADIADLLAWLDAIS